MLPFNAGVRRDRDIIPTGARVLIDLLWARSCADTYVNAGLVCLAGFDRDCRLHGRLHRGDLRIRQLGEGRPPAAGEAAAVLETEADEERGCAISSICPIGGPGSSSRNRWPWPAPPTPKETHQPAQPSGGYGSAWKRKWPSREGQGVHVQRCLCRVSVSPRHYSPPQPDHRRGRSGSPARRRRPANGWSSAQRPEFLDEKTVADWLDEPRRPSVRSTPARRPDTDRVRFPRWRHNGWARMALRLAYASDAIAPSPRPATAP